ncbi:hypothetical protein DSO57_1011664 [Entomophthora muscae]|uniref:Uncharacterized protein n=1 Tax=Entomophthora muscae TaxID=34485 RepID=A0ACC2RX80_9FUNG|nr:hypothetical protein DSO57_1011664 [Entomophthora muscae]
MVVMINFHTPCLAGNFFQASEAYRHLINDIFTTHKPNQSKTPAQAKAEKKLLDEEYLNYIATCSPDFTAYMLAVKFYADQYFEQLQETPTQTTSFEEKFHSLNTRFGMDSILPHDAAKVPVLECATSYCCSVIHLAAQH